MWKHSETPLRSGSRFFLRRVTLANLIQNTSCIRKPQVISWGEGVRTPCSLPLNPPLPLHLHPACKTGFIFSRSEERRSARHARRGKAPSPSLVSSAPCSLHASLSSPEKCENLTPVLQATPTAPKFLQGLYFSGEGALGLP